MRDWQAYVRDRLSLPDLTPERESRIVRELAAQLEDFYRDAIARGATEADADAHARAQITDWGRMAKDVRRADWPHARPRVDRLTNAIEMMPGPAPISGGLLMFAHALRDARYAIRQLVKNPGFTLVALLTLALGIGATTTIFSVVNGVLLRPLPYADPDELVRVHELVPQYGRFSVAPANFLDWRQQNTVFERIATYTSTSATITGSDGPERVTGLAGSWDLFELLGVAPAIGGSFRADHDKPNANNVVVLSHGMWQRRFNGDAGIVGRSVTFSGTPVTIVGVMAPDFYFPNRTTEYWQPIGLDPANATRGGHFLGVVARMKSGITIERAGAEMKTIAERLAAQYPENSANESAEVVGLHTQVVANVRDVLLTLFAAVGVVILIACANVANLLLVRASVREREVAIRAALGAKRSRLVVQMLVESVVLAIAGAALGVLLAYLAITPIQTLSAGSIPRVADVTIDTNVLVFALGAALLTGILFGLVPGWHATRVGFGAVLKEGGRSSVSSGGRWVRSGLLVLEVALSLVLLVGAALLVRSFAKLINVDPGFQAEKVLAFQVSLPRTTYPDRPPRIAFFKTLIERLDALPPVTSAAITQTLSMRGDYVLSVTIQGRPAPKPGETGSANYRSISPGYFQTLGIPLMRGRIFDAREAESGRMVAVVDEAFAKHHFPNEDAIGRGIDIGNGTDGFYEIVGVVGNVLHDGLDAVQEPTMYVPFNTDVFGGMWVLARTDGDPAQLAGSVRQVVREIDSTLPAYAMNPMSAIVSESTAQRRFSMLLLTAFALIALFLAAVGLYGVVAYSVSQRTREIGLRMAIGANRGHVLRLVVGGGMKLAVVGVILGLAGAVALARYVATMLFQVEPSDPTSYGVTALVLLTVAALASYVPARRAMRVDPIVALHQE